MPRSGFCNVCFGRVWVTRDGGCANGHAPYAVSDIRDVASGDPEAPPGPPADYSYLTAEEAEAVLDRTFEIEETVPAYEQQAAAEVPEPPGVEEFFSEEATAAPAPERPSLWIRPARRTTESAATFRQARQAAVFAPLASFTFCVLCWMLETCVRR